MRAIKSVLIIGGSGFLGANLALRLREGYKVFATYFRHPVAIPGVTCLPMNIDNRNWVKRALYTIHPEVVIYAAGNNDLIWSEKNIRETERLHVSGPALIANAFDIMQPRFIFLSNPYVFDGTRGNYHENDIVLPWSALGKMKLGGENVVKSKYLNYIILRSSPLIGRSTGVNLSFLDRVRMRLDRGQTFEAYSHELHSYAPAQGLADAIARLVDSGVRNRVLHFGGLTKATPYDLARAVASKFGYDANLVLPKKPTSRKSNPEVTNYDYSLNSTQTTEILKIKPFLLEESLDLVQQQLVPGSRSL